MDPKRVNEFGTSGEDVLPGTPEGAAITNGPSHPSSQEAEKSTSDKKND